GEKEWLNLGWAAADAKWGKGRGRSWSFRMAYAPDLQGAFLAGQGVHGYIRPDGRYDDVFFYDINAHRWVCIFPGINTKTFVEDIKKGEYKINGDGQLVDKDGQPVLAAYVGHSYLTHTYDTDLRKWATSGGQGPRAGASLDQYAFSIHGKAWGDESKRLLDELSKGKTDRVVNTPHFFNTLSGQLERFADDGPGLVPIFISIFYLPSKKLLWHY